MSRSNRRSSVSTAKKKRLCLCLKHERAPQTTLASTPRSSPKKHSDSPEPCKTSSTHTNRFCRKPTAHQNRTTSRARRWISSGTIFYLVLIVNRIYRCAAQTSRPFIHLQTRQIRTKKTNWTRQSCRRALLQANPPASLSKSSRNDFQHAIKPKMRAASPA